jgi:hypothetical protein
MTLAEIADLLSIDAGISQRTIGESDVRAWHMVLGDIDFAAAVPPSRDHYRENTAASCPPTSSGASSPRRYESAEKGIF